MVTILGVYVLSVGSSLYDVFKYRVTRLRDLGINGYKLDPDRLDDFCETVPETNNLLLFVPIYNMFISRKISRDYYRNKDYYIDLLESRRIVSRMDDNEFTEYRENKRVTKLLDISSRKKEDNELLNNIRDYLFDIVSTTTEYDKKKVISFEIDNDNHFEAYYDNKKDEFITINKSGLFAFQDNDKLNLVLYNVSKLLGSIYTNYDKNRYNIKDNDSLHFNVLGYDCRVKFNNLYNYVPDDVFVNTEKSQYKKLIKK